MRDSVAAEMLGLPTLLVVLGAVEGVAVETREVAGMPELAIVPIRESLFGLSRIEVAERARMAVGPAIPTLIAVPGT